MKLSKVDCYLDWPVSIKVINLREHIITNLARKGEIIRWAIIDIQDSVDRSQLRKLRIHAVLIT